MPNSSTKYIHKGVHPDPETGATHVPIHQVAGFEYNSAKELENVFHGREFGHYYSRVSNPTISALETRLSAIEDGVGGAVLSSGMAAISSTVMALAKAGDNIVVGQSLFGSTHYLFSGMITDAGIEVRFVDPVNLNQFEENIDNKTRLLFVETIGNPKLDVPNLKALSAIATKNSIPLVVDSTFTTPYLCSAKELGVHIVLYATTKYIAGSGTSIGGAVVDTGLMRWKHFQGENVASNKAYGQLAFLASLKKVRSNAGSCQSPFNAFLTSLGLDTLPLRMRRHSENALALAQFLEKQTNIITVKYPGLNQHPQHIVASEQFDGLYGGMVTIRLGSKKKALQLVDTLKLVKNLVNLGDAKTLAVHPAGTIYRHLTEQQRNDAGVYDDLIRISVGLEDAQDIIEDFKQALEGLE